jgi:hypothetical protein
MNMLVQRIAPKPQSELGVLSPIELLKFRSKLLILRDLRTALLPRKMQTLHISGESRQEFFSPGNVVKVGRKAPVPARLGPVEIDYPCAV